jgi:hypothetical protein
MIRPVLTILLGLTLLYAQAQQSQAWLRICQLGYTANGLKTAVLAAKTPAKEPTFELVEATTHHKVFSAPIGKSFGSYGPFTDTRRLEFSAFKKPGNYYIMVGGFLPPLPPPATQRLQSLLERLLQYA